MNDNIRSLDPNEAIDQIETLGSWLLEIMANNGSDELNEEGGLAYQHYSPATMTAIASAFAYARLLRMISANIFQLHQGDLTEEQFHHALEEGANELEESNPFTEYNDEEQ